MQVRTHFSNYEVAANRGRVAISRGPLIYCAEEIDNASRLDRLTINPEKDIDVNREDSDLSEIVSLSVSGSIEEQEENSLYPPFCISEKNLRDKNDSVLRLGQPCPRRNVSLAAARTLSRKEIELGLGRENTDASPQTAFPHNPN
jgi:hypothetical protein